MRPGGVCNAASDAYACIMSTRVLTVQSHVVRGYVGNKAAVFPLQLLGIEVDAINSVQFSNHTGYKSFRGERLDGDQLRALLDGLSANSLVDGQYSHLLTGYIGSLSFLQAVAHVASTLRAGNPDLQYVCDPVLGDGGKLYVPEQLVEAYKTDVIPLANIVTPNQFEASLLTGIPVVSLADALAACDKLHAMGPHTVVITSMDVPDDNGAALTLVGSTALPQAPGMPSKFTLRVPKRPGYFTGTGDLTAALLLARFAQTPDALASAAELAIASVQGVIAQTAEAAAQPGAPAPPAGIELRLVAGAGHITQPRVVHRATDASVSASM